jgi:hypothetical protein
MKILVTGGRDYADWDHVRSVLAEYRDRSPSVIQGGASGADALAGWTAALLGYPSRAYPANWEKWGKAAGAIRNREMLDLEPDLVIAFPGGRGTADCVREARRRGIAVRDERVRS